MVRTTLAAIMLSAMFMSQSAAQVQAPLNLMPLPATVQMGNGRLVIGPTFSVAITGHKEARLEHAVQLFFIRLGQQIGMPPIDMVTMDSPRAALVIQCAGGTKDVQALGEDESYRLEITGSGARLSAPTTLGVMRGLQTFLQLVTTTSEGFAAPAITIDDSPRFPWRGLMIDVSRHFIPIEVLKRNLDGMAAVKLNVFHWHLSDNQGFRVESKTFPKLQEMGSDGLYYTQSEVRDLIAYARERGIRVVPEFDMPGHSTAWFVGYPELASGRDRMRSSASGACSIPAMDPTARKRTNFWTSLSARWQDFSPTSFFISAATR